MELRYMGFDQNANTRSYRFDRIAKGEPVVEIIMSVDMTLFVKHHIGVQEGPALCAHKLAVNEASLASGQLTDADLRAFADARSASIALKADLRSRGGRGARPHAAPAFNPFRTQG